MKRKTSLIDTIGVAGLLVAAFVVLNVLGAVLAAAGFFVAHGEAK